MPWQTALVEEDPRDEQQEHSVGPAEARLWPIAPWRGPVSLDDVVALKELARDRMLVGDPAQPLEGDAHRIAPMPVAGQAVADVPV